MGATTKHHTTDRRWVYGEPEMILVGGAPRLKYPPEVEACAHLYDSRASRFTPAPPRDGLWCGGCRKLLARDKFKTTTSDAPPLCLDCQAVRDKGVWCCGCREWLSKSAFHKHAKRASGVQSFCIDCQKAHRKGGKRLKNLSPSSDQWYRG